MEEQNIEYEVDLLGLVYALVKKWWLIVCCGIITATIAMFVTVYFMTPQYKSSAKLYVLSQVSDGMSMSDLQIGAALISDFEIIATSNPVLDASISMIEKENNKTFTRKQIKDMVKVSSESRILIITTTCDDPWDACLVANAMAESVAERLSTIIESKPSIIEPAEIAPNPVGPNLLKNTILGGVIGVFLVCAVLSVLFILNDKVGTEEDIEKYLGISTLAVIPYIDANTRRKEGRKDRQSKKNKK